MSARKKPVAPPEPLDYAARKFQPFSWLHPDLKNGRIEFAALALDVCEGIDVILGVLHVDHMTRTLNADEDPSDQEAPLFGPAHTEKLMRLAMVSARMLSAAASQRVDWANAAARKGTKS